ncbi:MAG: hypothetical protein H6729_11280 [Deltaproteobacteria bacterium]|nr:hypothetical protein [Deltaproteobacteria bacterium]
MIRRAQLALALVAVSGMLAACQEHDGDLTGSIGGAYGLDFDQIHAYRLGAELVVAYEKSFQPDHRMYVNPILNQPARLVVRTDRQAVAVGEPITVNMADTYYPAIALERYVIDSAPGRGVFQAPRFPSIAAITVHFSELGEETGDMLTGEFACDFMNEQRLTGRFRVALGAP